jgi:bacillithiol biosynthesis cysteine-adding enzyme BshC
VGDISMPDRVIPVDVSDFYEPLYRDFISGKGSDPARPDVSFRDPGSWRAVAEEALSSSTATDELWNETAAYNSGLGASDVAMRSIEELSRRLSAAVLGGQQPGLLGGPLLVLYKAATTVALSDYVADVTGIPCSPIFVVAADDSDVAEVSRCDIYDGLLRRLTLRFPNEGFPAGGMVGGLSVVEEGELASSLLESFPDAPGRDAVSAVLEDAGGKARDHGEFVAGLLSSLFSSEGLVLLDGRSPAMRKAGAALFRSYVSRGDELKGAVEAAGRRMADLGYHAQITGASLESWLFMLEDGVRKKATQGAMEAIGRAIDDSPESVSPNVALRPIWRESTLPTVCCVCGPSEVAYTLQLKDAYRILGVRAPVLFPRLSATLLPPEAEETAGEWSEKALGELLSDFDAAQTRHYLRRVPRSATRAIESAKKSLEESLRGPAEVLRNHSDRWGKAADSVGKSALKGLNALEREMINDMKQDDRREKPRLKGLGEFLLPEGKLQERTLSLLYPLLEKDLAFAKDVVDLARAHIRESVSGSVRHYCLGLGAEKRRSRRET